MMPKIIASVAPHRRKLGILLSVSVVVAAAAVGYGVVVSPASRAMARQPQLEPVGAALATPAPASEAKPAAESSPSTDATSTTPAAQSPAATPATPAAPKAAEATWPERVTGRVVDGQKQPLPGALATASIRTSRWGR